MIRNLAIVIIVAGLLWPLLACNRVKYVCPAYQSAFVLDMPAYKVNKALDSMALAADTSLDIDVIAVLAERIYPKLEGEEEEESDSMPKFPDDNVVKTEVLLIKKLSKKKKTKLLANVPMITLFPASTDSAKAEDGEPAPPDQRPEGESLEETPAEKPAEEKKEENPF